MTTVVKEKYTKDLKNFVVGGASKRGWTTWTTAAVDDRVVAIVPVVIDLLIWFLPLSITGEIMGIGHRP